MNVRYGICKASLTLKGIDMLNHVKERRLLLGLTQEQHAERVGVSRQTIISIEGNRYDPSLSLALKLASLLGDSVEGLFIPQED